jgi:endoglucanase
MKNLCCLIILTVAIFMSCKKDDTEILPESVSISNSSLDMLVGDSETLTAIISPTNASNKKIVWESSNSSVASITNNGFIKALSEGNCTITATTTNGKKAECAVTVKAIVVPTYSMIKAVGKKLYNLEEEAIMLRGTNIGSWLVQEDWMTGNTAGCQKQMIKTLTNRFGASICEELIDLWEEKWITESDLDNIKNLGFNCIRVPFTFMNLVKLDDYSWKDDAFERLDWIIQQCSDREIYVILDMHGAPGSQNGSDHSGIDGGNAKELGSKFFFGDSIIINQNKYYEIWRTIAERYKGNKAVAGYDVLNEPFCTYRYNSSIGESTMHSLLFGVYDKVYDTIRTKDPDHMIVFGATWDPWDLPKPSSYGWTNIMYEYHNYEYSDYDNENGKQISSMTNKLNNIKNYDATYNVPNLLGEFCFMNNPDAWREGMALLNTYGAHWTSWNYKVQNYYGNWGIYNCSTNNINIKTASESSIRSAWSNVTSVKNPTLSDIMSDYATGKTTY